MNEFVLDFSNKNAVQIVKNCITFIQNLTKDKKWQVTIKPYRLNRSNSQNNYLWGVVYKTIVENDAGHFFSEEVEKELLHKKIKKEEVIHEFFKARFLPNIDVNGVKITPSTTKLSTEKFKEYCENIMALSSYELGIYIPTPEEKNLNDYQKWWGG